MSAHFLAGDGPIRSPLLERRAGTPDRTALIDAETDTRWTYRELDEEVTAVASALEERSYGWERETEQRPRIGYVLPPSPEFVTTLYAIWELGWTAVGVHGDLTQPELETHVETGGLDALVVDSELSMRTDLGCPTIDIDALAGAGHGVPSGHESKSDGRRIETYDPDETALILFTSGTTGEPKAVRLTLGNLLSSATASAFRLGVDPDDRWLCCLPVSHMGGLAPAVRTTLYGTTLVVQREFEAAETATVIDEYGITAVSLVPTQLERLLESGWTPPETLDTVLLGGAPATEALLKRADRAGVPAYPTYGMTETASQIATGRPAERREYPETVGQPLLWTDVTILNDGGPVSPGETGEIVVDGPTVTPGYLEEEHTAEAFGEYGLHTGDIGYRDGDGRLWVVGRADDVIVTGGELVSPAEVVDVLRAQKEIEDAAVVGIPDEEWGERVAALVVPGDGASLDERAVRAACRDNLAAYKIPKTVEIAERIPRTATGTVDREAVRELLGG